MIAFGACDWQPSNGVQPFIVVVALPTPHHDRGFAETGKNLMVGRPPPSFNPVASLQIQINIDHNLLNMYSLDNLIIDKYKVTLYIILGITASIFHLKLNYPRKSVKTFFLIGLKMGSNKREVNIQFGPSSESGAWRGTQALGEQRDSPGTAGGQDL